MRLVLALGGTALLRRSQQRSAENQLANVRIACAQVARLAAAHDMVLTHGNGPQVGLLALLSAAYTAVDSYPLDVLDAETEGMLGYLLEQALANLLPASRAVASLLTRVEVDPRDPGFLVPTKPIGPVYTKAQADELTLRRRWAMAAGGGGIPIVPRPDGGGMQGVDAVIDTDLCSALLATELQADCLIIATDVDAVYLDWGLPTQRAVGRTEKTSCGEWLSPIVAFCVNAPLVKNTWSADGARYDHSRVGTWRSGPNASMIARVSPAWSSIRLGDFEPGLNALMRARCPAMAVASTATSWTSANTATRPSSVLSALR